MHSRLLAVAVVMATIGVGGPASAWASQRPVNGQITFGRFDPALGDFSIWAADPDGIDQRRLTTVPSFFSDWSPDGHRIAFDFVDDVGVHIATMAPDGGRQRQLTFGPAIQEVPKWSPDGRSITFDASPTFPDDPTFHTSVWIMSADGSRARQLTHDGFDVEPAFSPDSRDSGLTTACSNTPTASSASSTRPWATHAASQGIVVSSARMWFPLRRRYAPARNIGACVC